ncbi:MAG: hypothetical protein LBI04_05010, partial [Treponema sp.]|nr:hypothetical protein [Treponema sp.]
MRKFSTLCAFLILAGFVVLTTCDSPNALGSQVPLPKPLPVVSIEVIGEGENELGKKPGAFISGTEKVYVQATVERGKNIKSITAKLTYLTGEYDEDGKPKTDSKTKDIPFDPETGLYTLDIDTLNLLGEDPPVRMADGALKVIITAVDNEGNTTITPELIYTVKNNPPQISMQIPKPLVDGNILNNTAVVNGETDKLDVVTNTFLMGVFEDLAGVDKYYPQIKFWKYDEIEPTNYKQNAGWEKVDSYDDDDPDTLNEGWVRFDEGTVDNGNGEKGGSLRYYLRERKSNGDYEAEEAEKPLPAGLYCLKIRAKDIIKPTEQNDRLGEWPKCAFDFEMDDYFLIVRIIDPPALSMPPDVTITTVPNNEYQRDNFKIEAKAEVGEEDESYIIEMTLTVTGNDGKPVTLYIWNYDGEEKTSVEGTFEIKLDKTYSSITFGDGSYNFSLSATSGGLPGKDSITAYVDRQDPVTTVTGVEPYYSQDRVTGNAYRQWTVNKTTKISVSSMDNRGNAYESEENGGYMKFKYLFIKGADIFDSGDFTEWQATNPKKTLGEFIYSYTEAEFFDNTKDNPVPSGNSNPMIAVEESGGTYALTLQTHEYDSDSQYKLWFYIAAMDNAGNIGYSKILLNVDQDTDKPKIESQNIENAFMGKNSSIEFTVRDDNKLSENSVYYRFAKDAADKSTVEALSDGGWKQLTAVSLSVDELSISTKDFNLQKITADHSAGLGKESDAKYIQIRVVDDASNKIYATDGEEITISKWYEFAIDLTSPEIVLITAPEKDHVYTDSFDFVRGDLKEANLKSITVKFDGEDSSDW